MFSVEAWHTVKQNGRSIPPDSMGNRAGVAMELTQNQLAQITVQYDALTFAFQNACGGAYQFDKLPFHTQSALAKALGKIIERGTDDLMASATTVVHAWIYG